MKTGQKKFDARFGWGVVREVTDKSVKVQFAIDVCEYTLEGKDQVHQLVAMLRDEEYKTITKKQMQDAFVKCINIKDSNPYTTITDKAELYYKQNYDK